MRHDFHYYATYCAALIAGYSEQESHEICSSAQLVDRFSRTLLKSLGAPLEAATTQVAPELAAAKSDPLGIQDTTRIWASFHFLPRDLHAPVKKGSKRYKNKYRLICGPNGNLLEKTVELAKGKSLQAAGLAMHVLADTWAHRNFAGTPSLVINNVSNHVVEIVPDGDGFIERPLSFMHNPTKPEDPETGNYMNAPFQPSETFVVNLGHGRMGHLPDYSFMRYRYLPAWGDYEEILKDNPKEYYKAFSQMVHALQYLHGDISDFVLDTYATHLVAPWEERIRAILEKRQLDSSEDWRSLGAEICGTALEDFDLGALQEEYRAANDEEKDHTVLGKYILAALSQKSMVTSEVFKSGNTLAGRSIEYDGKRLAGLKDYIALVREHGLGDDYE